MDSDILDNLCGPNDFCECGYCVSAATEITRLRSASSAAADEVGRLRGQVAFLNRAGSVYEAEAKAARLMLTDAGLPVHYSLTREQWDMTNEDSHEYINARAGTDEFIASLATDASGAMTKGKEK